MEPRGAEAKLAIEPGAPFSLQLAWMAPPDLSPDSKAKEVGTAVTLRRRYSSSNTATKADTVCGNHVVTYPADDLEEKPVCVFPAFVYGGKLYGNEYGRPDLGVTTPPTNSSRDRLVGGGWFHSLLVPTLRDRWTLDRSPDDWALIVLKEPVPARPVAVHALTPEQLKGIEVHYVSHVEEVLDIALPKSAREEQKDAEVKEKIVASDPVAAA